MTADTATRKGAFRGGPLDGQRHEVPGYRPPFVRWWGEPGAVHWYVLRPKTKQTYEYLGDSRYDPARP